MSMPRRSTSGNTWPFTSTRSFQPSLSKSKKAQPQPTKRVLCAEAGGDGDIVKLAVAGVAIEGLALVRKVDAENVEPAVSVVVGRGEPHAGQRAAVFVESHAAQHGLFEKRAVALVDEQQRGRLVAGHVDVGPPVVVEVLGQYAERVVAGQPWRSRSAPRHLRKCRRRCCDTAGWCRTEARGGRS